MSIFGKSNSDVDAFKDLKPHGLLFDIYIRRLEDEQGDAVDKNTEPYVYLLRLFAQGKSPQTLKRGFKLKNLKLGRFQVQLRPIPLRYDSKTTYRVVDSGVQSTISTGVTINGKEVKIELESGGTIDDSEIDDLIQYDVKKRTVSSESNPPAKVTTINEVVLPSDIGGSTNYPGIALSGYKILASERLTGAPNLSMLVSKGRKIRQHLFAGIASAGSAGSTLTNNTAFFIDNGLDLATGEVFYIRNLDKSLEARITQVTPSTITAAQSLNWFPQDRYLVYTLDSSNYFPDIFVDTFINKEGGLGNIIDGDQYVDYPSIVNSRRFCVENDLFWDGVIGTATPWSRWVTDQAPTSLLFPVRLDGRYGLIPEEASTPVAIFNESNILKGTYQEDSLPWQELALNKLTLTYLDGSLGRFTPKAILIMTDEAYNGSEAIVEQSLQLESVRNRLQAIKIGSLLMKTKRSQNKAIKFRTATQALFLQPGEIIIVQHKHTEYEYHVSGFVTEIQPFDEGNQVVRLSRQPVEGITPEYKANVHFRNQSNSELAIQKDISFSVVYVGGVPLLEFTGLREGLVVGDPVVIGKDLEHESQYRIQAISFDELGNASITAIIWKPEFLNTDNLNILEY